VVVPRSQLRRIPLRVLAVAIVVATLGAACGDLAAALTDHFDERCCRNGVCCCRPHADEGGACLRAICACGGHDAVETHALVEPAGVPPVTFHLQVVVIVSRRSPARSVTALDGHGAPIDHPPPSPRFAEL
jgi:hypothetical protein